MVLVFDTVPEDEQLGSEPVMQHGVVLFTVMTWLKVGGLPKVQLPSPIASLTCSPPLLLLPFLLAIFKTDTSTKNTQKFAIALA